MAAQSPSQALTQTLMVLDTNIISETLKQNPNDNVIAWLLQNQEHLYLTAITIGELLEGAYRLPEGKRRENLLLAIERIIIGYKERILVYDGNAAQVYASLQDESRRNGRTLTVEDGMIAAICLSQKATLATRNTRDFSPLRIALANPFEDPTPDITIIDLDDVP